MEIIGGIDYPVPYFISPILLWNSNFLRCSLPLLESEMHEQLPANMK